MGMKYRDPETGQFKDLKVKTSDTLPIGTQVAYGGTVPPTGWLICDGSAVSRTTYAELFKVIGTSYGAGDGSTTFNLPNKKGRVSAGYDSTNSKFNAIGKKLGEETHTHIINGTSLTLEQIPSHNHSGTTNWAGEHAHTFNGYAPNRMATGNSDYAFVSNAQSHTDVIDSSGSHQHTFTTSYTGSGKAHTHDINNVSNIQPTEVDNWIIKAFQSIGVVGKVVNTKTNSDNDTYSCDYINYALEEHYSTEETFTGKYWIDGKPIYRKILNFTLGTQNQYERVEHGISNIYWIISQTVNYNYGGNIYYAPNGHITETNVNGTYFSYFNNNSYIVGSNAYAILEYTKTTE